MFHDTPNDLVQQTSGYIWRQRECAWHRSTTAVLPRIWVYYCVYRISAIMCVHYVETLSILIGWFFLIRPVTLQLGCFFTYFFGELFTNFKSNLIYKTHISVYKSSSRVLYQVAIYFLKRHFRAAPPRWFRRPHLSSLSMEWSTLVRMCRLYSGRQTQNKPFGAQFN